MTQEEERSRFGAVGEGSDLAPGDGFYKEEVQLALRNRGMPLEGLRYDITPVGMHYLLIHFDIPEVPDTGWRLQVGGLVSKPISLTLDEDSLTATVMLLGSASTSSPPRSSTR